MIGEKEQNKNLLNIKSVDDGFMEKFICKDFHEKRKEILKLYWRNFKEEYAKDRKDIENIVNTIKREDMLAKEELNRKRNIARTYMENSYARKEQQKKKEKEDELLEKEKERKYLVEKSFLEVKME